MAVMEDIDQFPSLDHRGGMDSLEEIGVAEDAGQHGGPIPLALFIDFSIPVRLVIHFPLGHCPDGLKDFVWGKCFYSKPMPGGGSPGVPGAVA